MTMDPREVQPLNAESPSCWIESERVMEDMEVQSLKTKLPRELTEAGIVMVVREVHP